MAITGRKALHALWDDPSGAKLRSGNAKCQERAPVSRTAAHILALLLASLALVGCGDGVGDTGAIQPGSPAASTQAPLPSPSIAAPGPADPPLASIVSPTVQAASNSTTLPSVAPEPATGSEVAAQPTSSPALPPEGIAYTVQEGDTLGAIALEYDTTVDDLMRANELDSADTLYVGETLRVVPPDSARASAQTERPGESQEQSVPGVSAPALAPTQQPAVVQRTPAPRKPVVVNGRAYNAYNPVVLKKGQWFQYTCEFDAAWMILKTYGFDVGLEEQAKIVGLDKGPEPYYKETKNGTVIYGGDITKVYSGNYKKNFLARSTGVAMRKVFEKYGLQVTPVRDRASLEAALLRGEPVWIKTTVDFKPWRTATWIMPDGRAYKTVLGNDHALVVVGFNKDGVAVRDQLGPTSTNWNRKYDYDVPWAKFLAAWGAQQFDGLAVAPPKR